MSPNGLNPPQTYSRLFRPWDTKNSSQDNTILSKNNNNCNKSDNIKENYELNSVKIMENISISPLPSIYDPIRSSATYFGQDITLGNIIPPTNEYFLPTELTVPFMGVDPVTMRLMEQEYARVIVEDAQTKAINARKQRPKKFKCPHCNVAFSNNGQLKGHIRIHTGERPFKCDVESCGKTFTRNEELTRHKRIHTGLRPFACSTCGKKFGRRDHLKKHMKTHLPQERQLGPTIFVPMYPYLYGY